MSVLAHLLRPAAGARRAYSAFSKPGGGRFFIPAKHLKDAPSPTKTNVDSSNSDAAASSVDESAPMSSGAPPTAETSSAASTFSMTPQYVPVHPRINAQDLKMHQFFSLHRPLLTIAQPPSSLFESHPTIFPVPPSSSSETSQFGSHEDNMDVSPEADADAARQLARAMVVNRIGASLAWEETLQRLGLDVTSGRAEEVSMAEAEFEMYMDSTKRKRRKKMKKHKLKKRRRLNRAQRLKIGR